MKRLIIILLILFSFAEADAQFPGTDSLRNYNNIWITNNAARAFTNYRLHTLLAGMIDWIDSARAGVGGTIGVDSIGVLNDSTFRYRKNGVFQSIVIKGGAVQHDITLTGTGLSGSHLKVDTTILKTVADAQRVTDSLMALIALKLNISDTAAMMQPLYDYIASDTLHIYTAADPSPDSIYSYKNGDSTFVGYIFKGTLTSVNLDTTRTSSTVTITNDAGTNAVIPLVNKDESLAGLMSPEDKAHVDSSKAGLLIDTTIVLNNGSGEPYLWASKDTLNAKRFHDTTFISWGTLADSSIYALIDTAGLYAASSGGGGGTPGGNDTEVQFNDGGSFGGDVSFTYNKTSNKVTTDSASLQRIRIGDYAAGLLGAYPIEVSDPGNAIVSIHNSDATTANSKLYFKTDYATLANSSKVAASIEAGPNGNGGALKFYTAADGTGTLTQWAVINRFGNLGIGTGSPTTRFHISESDATTNAILYPVIIEHNTSATAATIGVGIEHGLENGSGSYRPAGRLYTRWTTATSGNESADMAFNLYESGTSSEKFRIVSDGTLLINNAYSLPNADGSNGQVLTTDGAGNVTFQTSGSGITSINSQTQLSQSIGSGSVFMSVNSSGGAHTLTVLGSKIDSVIDKKIKDSAGYYSVTATTVNNTVTTVAEIPVTSGQIYTIFAECVAITDDGDATYSATKSGSHMRTSGGTFVGATATAIVPDTYLDTGSGLTTATFTISNDNSTNAIITIAGETSTTIFWKIRYRIIEQNAAL